MKILKLLILLVYIILHSNMGYSQEQKYTNDSYYYPFGYHLLKKKYVLIASVERIGPYYLFVNVTEGIKPKKIVKKKIKIWYNFNLKDRVEPLKALGIEPKISYVFILRWNTHGIINRYQLSQNLRFKISNDSTFIDSKLLLNLELEEKELIYQPNIFGDSLMPYGYKISISDFITLTNLVNDSFVLEKKNFYRYVGEKSSNEFADAIIKELKEAVSP